MIFLLGCAISYVLGAGTVYVALRRRIRWRTIRAQAMLAEYRERQRSCPRIVYVLSPVTRSRRDRPN